MRFSASGAQHLWIITTIPEEPLVVEAPAIKVRNLKPEAVIGVCLKDLHGRANLCGFLRARP